MEVMQVRTAICLGLLPFLFGWTGCRPATPVSPRVETYSVEANRNELVAGKKQNVEILIRYLRSDRAAAPLKYKVQLSAPGDLKVTPNSWDVQQNLTSKDAGFNYTGLATLEVAEDAPAGEVEVAAKITPAQGTPTTATLKFRVAKKGG